MDLQELIIKDRFYNVRIGVVEMIGRLGRLGRLGTEEIKKAPDTP